MNEKWLTKILHYLPELSFFFPIITVFIINSGQIIPARDPCTKGHHHCNALYWKVSMQGSKEWKTVC